jgi:hypothetical protein
MEAKMTEQEIKVKALELTIQVISLMSEEKREEQLGKGVPSQVIIGLSQDFHRYLKDEPK